MESIRNVFISHTHKDNDGVSDTKRLLERHGMTCRNGSITLDKFNAANNEDYIKYQVLAPRINWSSVLVVYVTPDTKRSRWVDWEIEYARKQGKRIVGVWERGKKGCDLPEPLDRYADAIVGWNGESLIAAIEGTFNGRTGIASSRKSGLGSFMEEWMPVIGVGAAVFGTIYLARKLTRAKPESQMRTYPARHRRLRERYDGFCFP